MFLAGARLNLGKASKLTKILYQHGLIGAHTFLRKGRLPEDTRVSSFGAAYQARFVGCSVRKGSDSKERIVMGAISKHTQDRHSFVDIGCGQNPKLIFLAKDAGFAEAGGIDISSAAIMRNILQNLPEIHNRAPGLSWAVWDITERPFPFPKSSVITAMSVLEHLPVDRTAEFFSSVYEALAPQGLFVVHVPSVKTPLAKLLYSFMLILYGVSQRSYLDFTRDPTHVQRFSLLELMRCGTEASFKVLDHDFFIYSRLHFLPSWLIKSLENTQVVVDKIAQGSLKEPLRQIKSIFGLGMYVIFQKSSGSC